MKKRKLRYELKPKPNTVLVLLVLNSCGLAITICNNVLPVPLFSIPFKLLLRINY